jgi:hypothetical protein
MIGRGGEAERGRGKMEREKRWANAPKSSAVARVI